MSSMSMGRGFGERETTRGGVEVERVVHHAWGIEDFRAGMKMHLPVDTMIQVTSGVISRYYL